MVHSSQKFSLHCAYTAAKANVRAKLILKCFSSRKPCNFIRAFKTYVRPSLEYASVAWNPWLMQDINVIENVQRRFTRTLCTICHLPVMSYDECLTLFNLERLELRRLRTDLGEMFKIVHGYTKCNIFNSLFFSCNNACNTTRGHVRIVATGENIVQAICIDFNSITYYLFN
jgi:hypothetical protein